MTKRERLKPKKKRIKRKSDFISFIVDPKKYEAYKKMLGG